MKYIVCFWAENNGNHFEVFDTKEKAIDSIMENMRHYGITTKNFSVFEGEEMQINAVEIATKIELK